MVLTRSTFFVFSCLNSLTVSDVYTIFFSGLMVLRRLWCDSGGADNPRENGELFRAILRFAEHLRGNYGESVW